MGQGEPLADMSGRFIGSRAVERHHRIRHARVADNVRAPAILGDFGDFDVVRAAFNSLVDVMHWRLVSEVAIRGRVIAAAGCTF